MVVRHQSINQIACGGNHSVVLLDSGDIFSWGESENGALGHGKLVDRSGQPRRLETLPEGEFFVAVACGYFHTIAASKVGDTYTWGWNDFGQLGLGNRESQAQPMILERMRNKKASTLHSLAFLYIQSCWLCLFLSLMFVGTIYHIMIVGTIYHSRVLSLHVSLCELPKGSTHST